MKKVQLIIIILSHVCISKAQYNIQGKIIDSSDGKGIEYATVTKEGTNIGCISDSAGNFSFNNLKTQPDSLLFSCVGYESKKVYKNEITKSQKLHVELKTKILELKEVIIKPLNKSLWLGDKRNTSFGVPLYFSSQQMRYFKPHIFPSYINQFSFYISNLTGNKKVRIRIYDVDTVKNCPHNDILISNLIIDNLKDGWNNLDLSKFNISVPQHGFFIGLESVVNDKDSFKKNNDPDKPYVTSYRDFVIGCTKESTTSIHKTLFLSNSERDGEIKLPEGANDWHIYKNRGSDLLYRVEIIY